MVKSLEDRLHVEREGSSPAGTMQDWYQRGSVQPLYTGPVDDGPSFSQPDPVDGGADKLFEPGSHGGFSANKGSLRRGLNTGVPEQHTHGKPLLQERYDFSGHKNDDSDKPYNLHLNTDLPGASNNGANALGPAHEKNLNVSDAEVAAAQKEMEHRNKMMQMELEKKNKGFTDGW